MKETEVIPEGNIGAWLIAALEELDRLPVELALPRGQWQASATRVYRLSGQLLGDFGLGPAEDLRGDKFP
jgi:hypothetical protein